MDFNHAIKVLEALASGCSPLTGEVINESILSEREVIRALQIAIDELKRKKSHQRAEISDMDENVQEAVKLFMTEQVNITPHNLTGFFLASKRFKTESVGKHHLYGNLINNYTRGQLLDFFTEYLITNKVSNGKKIQKDLYDQVDFFQKEKFNRLSDNAINQLKEKINEIGILKTENLSEYTINSRKNHPRAYESWSEKEKELLIKALRYTNDLDILSECFQRGKGSIESLGKKIIYESQNLTQNE